MAHHYFLFYKDVSCQRSQYQHAYPYLNNTQIFMEQFSRNLIGISEQGIHDGRIKIIV